MKRTLLSLAAILISLLGNSTQALAISPSPTASFSEPAYGATISKNFTSVTATLHANGNYAIVGRTITIVPVICNSTDPYYADCEGDFASMKEFSFSHSNDSVTINWPTTALFYSGTNYITCYLNDGVTSTFCGGVDYPNFHAVNYTGGLLPLYRFWSEEKKHHFFTINNDEKNHVLNTYSEYTWKYEDVAFFANRPEQCYERISQPIYRFWSDTQQGHFYTMSEAEKNHIASTYPSHVWRYEGVGFCSDKDSTYGGKPVHRFWSDTQKGHFYTIDEEEKNHIINSYPSNVWRYEGVAFYAFR